MQWRPQQFKISILIEGHLKRLSISIGSIEIGETYTHSFPILADSGRQLVNYLFLF